MKTKDQTTLELYDVLDSALFDAMAYRSPINTACPECDVPGGELCDGHANDLRLRASYREARALLQGERAGQTTGPL